MNMTFPRMPCFLFSLDVVDIIGRHEVGVSHSITKIRVKEGQPVGTFESFKDDMASEMREEGFALCGCFFRIVVVPRIVALVREGGSQSKSPEIATDLSGGS